ncbi:MAG: YDG domain-containing protein, partial [Rhodoferax sp.]|uniref:two-partner secretion domain-containing protein n=1 Tax=Rhodoferax sp. TaxID=50421 RepID=UPI0026160984
MNRIYRLVWNHISNTWVCCAENAKGRSKSSSGRASRVVSTMAAVLASTALLTPWAQAGPTGGQVTAGSGSIAQTGQNGSTNTTINQGSQSLAINWQSFGIASNESVNFVQPNAAAIALNRVVGQDPSQILGSLSANGQVFILNPSGVLFGAGSQVNVGGLVASTQNLSDADFMAGKYSFSGASGSNASVVNQGTLTAKSGGYIALLAPEVRNQGVISARLGTALLAAGDKVTLQINNGSLLSFNIDQGALKALVDNKQLVVADGGQVFMSAKAADALSTAVVNNSGIIEARTVENVSGTIKLIGDMQVGTVNVGGTLDASAPSSGHGGKGGFIETSAAHVKIADSTKVTTQSANGLSGTWLIDPVDFTIAATGGDMTGAALSGNLAGGNVTIQSSTGASGTAGNVNVNDSVSWAANTLTLNAQNNININSAMNGSGTASLALQYGQGALAAGNTSTYKVNAPVNLPAGNNFSTLLGSDGAVVNYTVLTSLGAAGSSTATDLQGMNGNLGGNYVLGADIDASATSTWNTGAGFIPVGNTTPGFWFRGKFDGLGHSISGLTINRPSQSEVALFGRTYGSSLIQNVGLINATVTGGDNGGGLGNDAVLVGNNYGTVNGSYATGSVSGTANGVGGLVGRNSGGLVSNSYANVNVTNRANSVAGGLVGSNYGTVRNSYATGSTSGGFRGGLAGYNGGTISHSAWNSAINASGFGLAYGTQTSDVGLTTAQMQQSANFGTWDLTNIWVVYDGHSNPLLRSFMTPLTVTVGNTSKNYDATVYSGSAPSVTYSATPDVRLLGTLAVGGTATSAVNAGTYTNTGSGLYSTSQQGYAVTYVDGALTIAQKALTITGSSAANKTYDGTTLISVTPGTLSGFVGIETVSVGSSTGSFSNKNAGTGKTVTASHTLANGSNGGLASNYSITETLNADITPKALTVSATGVNKVYDGGNVASVILRDNRVAGDVLSLSDTSASFADKNVGTAKAVSVSGISVAGTDAG